MPRRSPEPDAALYVRLPAEMIERLRRAADALGVAQKDLVAGLVAKHVDPDSKRGLSALGELASQPRKVTIDMGGPTTTVGAYSFRPYDPPEVMTPAQAADLLQIDEAQIIALAEDGTLPGRKIGKTWRFARGALIAWLSGAP